MDRRAPRHTSPDRQDKKKKQFPILLRAEQTTVDKGGCLCGRSEAPACLSILKMQDDPKLEITDVTVEEGKAEKGKWLAMETHRAREKPIPPRKHQLT